MRIQIQYAALCVALLFAPFSLAQQDAAKPPKRAPQPKPIAAKRAKPVNPAFTAPEIDPSLPNVLLLGDSISMGYMLPVRTALQGQANVFRPATNCGPTTNGVAKINEWLGDRDWDVIHFNFGLHDLKYIGAKGDALADPQAPSSRQQVPLDQYTANLKQIAERLKQTGAVVIWCQTTPVPAGSAGRIAADEVRYNAAADKVMLELGGITIHEFHSFAAQQAASEQLPANVHYTGPGSQILGEQVAKTIREALKNRTPSTPAD